MVGQPNSAVASAEVESGRYDELDSLRGVAAATVVIGHYLSVWKMRSWWPGFNTSPGRILVAGHEAVILFFLLSGFVLAVPYAKAVPPGYREFIVRRVCRIYLPFLAAMLIAACGAALLYSPVPTGNPWIDQTWSRPFSWRLILQHVTMIGHYDNAQLNTAFWSLVYEMRISIIYPVLYWCTLRLRAGILLAGLFASTVAAALLAQRFGAEGFFMNLLYASFFVVGILVQRNIILIGVWLRARQKREVYGLAVLALLCFDGPGAFPAFSAFGSNVLGGYLQDWVTLVGAVLIVVLAINITGFRSILLQPLLRRLGAISYSVYLIHATVLFVLIRLFLGRGYFPWLFPVYLALTFAAAELFHGVVEQPTMQLGRKLGRRISRAGRSLPMDVSSEQLSKGKVT